MISPASSALVEGFGVSNSDDEEKRLDIERWHCLERFAHLDPDGLLLLEPIIEALKTIDPQTLPRDLAEKVLAWKANQR
jgi:hypothetical protein